LNIDTWLAYASTILILMSTPGPSHLLMLSNSIGNGFRKSVFTAAGDLSANFIQMVIASVGLVGIIASSREFFVVVKWLGVLYLVYLGARLLFFNPGGELAAGRQQRSNRSLYWQGFITSAANPKAVVFFAALFPQFINPGDELLAQFAVLSATYLLIDATFLCFYGKFAEWISDKLAPSARRHLDKASGTFLIGAAMLLGMKDIESR
jgi:threonine/homoserine/homoserine lactone efflux protein